tara:strand:- start:266 stop:493 length:228 start_codon:yes stop_codon:yes gene_type:complete
MNNPQQPQMNIDFSQTTPEVCELKECKNDTFQQVYQMRKLSALLSPTGQETMIPIQVFSCAKCGHINKGFLPKGE